MHFRAFLIFKIFLFVFFFGYFFCFFYVLLFLSATGGVMVKETLEDSFFGFTKSGTETLEEDGLQVRVRVRTRVCADS